MSWIDAIYDGDVDGQKGLEDDVGLHYISCISNVSLRQNYSRPYEPEQADLEIATVAAVRVRRWPTLLATKVWA